jgi:hypothetical protein
LYQFWYLLAIICTLPYFRSCFGFFLLRSLTPSQTSHGECLMVHLFSLLLLLLMGFVLCKQWGEASGKSVEMAA